MQYPTTLFEEFITLLNEMHADAVRELRSWNYSCVDLVDHTPLEDQKWTRLLRVLFAGQSSAIYPKVRWITVRQYSWFLCLLEESVWAGEMPDIDVSKWGRGIAPLCPINLCRNWVASAVLEASVSRNFCFPFQGQEPAPNPASKCSCQLQKPRITAGLK